MSLRSPIGWLGVLLAASGCASLDPRPEVQRARGFITERTGAADSYDPAEDDLVASKIGTLLEDGITVEEAVQVALLNNRGLQSAFQGIGVSRADYVQSGLLSNPTVTLGLLVPEGHGKTDIVVNFAQELVDLWQIPIRRKIARAQLEQAILNVAQQAVTAAADVRTRFYAILALQDLLGVAEEYETLSQSMMEWARGRANVTKTMDLDIALMQVNIHDAEAARVTAARDLELAEVQFARVLGLSREMMRWQLKGELPAPDADVPESNLLVALALEQRLDARAAALQAGAAWDELKRQYLNIFPSVTIGPSFERMESRALPGRTPLADAARASIAAGHLTAPAIVSRGQREQARRQIIDSKFGPAIGATLPLWDQNQAQIAKSRALAVQKRKDYEDLLDGIAADVLQAAINFRAADRLARFYREYEVPEAARGLELMRQAYVRGDEDTPTTIAQEQYLITQRQLYVNALRDRATALAALEQAVGGVLPMGTSSQPASAAAQEWALPRITTSRAASGPKE